MIDLTEIRSLIAEGRLAEAFADLESYSSSLNPNVNDELLLLKNQYNTLEKKITLNIVTEGEVELNKIVYGLVSTIRKVERGFFSSLDQGQNDTLQQIIQFSEARLIYMTNKELFAKFMVANQQVKRYLDRDADQLNIAITLRKNIQDILLLNEQVQEIQEFVQQKNIEFGDQDFVSIVRERLKYIFEEMSLSEAALQAKYLQRLLVRFHRRSLWQYITWAAIFIFLSLILWLFGRQLYL